MINDKLIKLLRFRCNGTIVNLFLFHFTFSLHICSSTNEIHTAGITNALASFSCTSEPKILINNNNKKTSNLETINHD